MIASLAMYDQPWLQPANDRLWRAIAAHLRAAGHDDVPDRLTRHADLDDVWRSPRLLLAQSCGYPLMADLRETVQIVATPSYRAQGCEGAAHRSAIIVRADHPAERLEDLRGSVLGVNGLRSNSGMNLLRAAIAPLARGEPFFGPIILTGGHARSFAGVSSGKLDVAAIDAVTLAHLRRRYPCRAEHIRVLAWTAPCPGLPLVTASTTSPETIAALRATLHIAASDPAMAQTMETLLIDGFEHLDLADYLPVLAFQDTAISQGYRDLR